MLASLTDDDRRAMLATVGAPSVDLLYSDVPQKVRLTRRSTSRPSRASSRSSATTALAPRIPAPSCSFVGAGAIGTISPLRSIT